MSIVFLPDEVLKKIAPKRKIERILSSRMSVKRQALAFLKDAPFIDSEEVAETALKTVRDYKKRIAKERSQRGASEGRELQRQLLASPKQLVQRIQNLVIWQINEKIQKKYKGKLARWLPSDAEEPDPLHQLNYGLTYIVGEGINGEEPGDREGCKCGVEILVDETSLDL